MRTRSVSIVLLLVVGAAVALETARSAAVAQVTPPTTTDPDRRVPIGSLPVTIRRSGSYVLERALTSSGGDGIVVDADDVTLDLGGFALDGNATGTNGVRVNGSHFGVVVRNGSVHDWTGFGVDLQGVEGGRAEQLEFLHDGTSAVPGSAGGMRVGTGFEVRDCTLTSNNQVGLHVGYACHVEQCRVNESVDVGIRVLGIATTIRDCVVWRAGSDGILLDSASNCLVVDDVVSECANGIHVANGGHSNRIEANSLTDNNGPTSTGKGVLVDSAYNALVFRNTARGNSGGNYSIPSGNDVGPIGTAAASTSPFANLSY